MPKIRRVSALCLHTTSNYHKLPFVDCYDKNRDANTFAGNTPIVAHPPCRTWSASKLYRMLAKPDKGERLLAIKCVEWLIQCGGVLEQPAGSHLFKTCGLPMPGHQIDDLFSIEVFQSWWGFRGKKPTWLCFSGLSPEDIELPEKIKKEFSLHWEKLTTPERSETVPAFAKWLVHYARKSRIVNPREDKITEAKLREMEAL